MSPQPKRQLRPTVSQPTTAEHYGAQHGISPEVQAALLNVGRKGRMAVSQGRQFDRTQSFPVLGSSSFLPQPSSSSFMPPPPVPQNSGFMSSQDTLIQAQDIIAKDVMRQNELRPFGDVSTFGSSPNNPASSPPRQASSAPKPIRGLTPSKKRRGDEEGSDTEVEDDTDDDETAVSVTSSTADFPPVFTSRQISQPELFAPAQQRSAGQPARRLRNIPGRHLGKTVSAPVGKLDFGSWTEPDAMDVEEVEEDGFDVSEWAASEKF